MNENQQGGSAIFGKIGLLLFKNPISLTAIGVILLLVALFGFTVLMVVTISSNGSSQSNSFSSVQNVSADVLQYEDDLRSELKKYGYEEYTYLLMALMMQESGGRGNDPMQASESHCGSIGCITNPSDSIKYGVAHFVRVLEKANKDINLTLQSYNFGGGFIDYVLARGGAYTYELAVSFSQMQYEKVKHTGIYKCHRPEAIEHQACYGDILYVQAVLQYLSPVDSVIGNSTGDLSVVLNEIKKYNGYPYLMGAKYNNPATGYFDCSGLMQWSFKQIGVNLPRSAAQQYNATKPVPKSEAKPGDLVFFINTYKKGVSHVGIYLGDNKMYHTARNPEGVEIREITGYWQDKFYSFNRVVNF